MKFNLNINKLNKSLVILTFFILLVFNYCKKNPEIVKTFYHTAKLDLLPWGISPTELKNQYKDFLINETEQYIELGIKAELKDQKQIPILKELESPLIFRLICDHFNNQCVIFRIEKLATQQEIEIYYDNFIKNNNIIDTDLKNQQFKEYTTDAGNTIKENYKLFETKNYIIEVYITHMIFPEDIHNSKSYPIEENSDIDIRIYSKKYNPNLNLDFFINN